ncbi:sphingosine 1-phosphate receptor 1-like [Dendronephthya gigantea]|uniref:sphingosine 1-phosphate receptor 1-like n=1 Tax=Dendronephthya gigantea TaxID=151771 RepID=UPI00106A4E6C|nr:sphingosine 1-phosphate receptor 1-like [Dendronephthya gigantea]
MESNHTAFCEYQDFIGAITTWNFVVYFCIIFTAVTANVMLLFGIYRNPLKCFRNPTTYFITNLAIADLLNALYYLVQVLATQTTYKTAYCFPAPWPRMFSAIGNVAYFITVPSVTILALERYVSIAHPLWHQVKVTSRLCFTCIALVWIVTATYTAIIQLINSGWAIFVTIYPSVFYLTTVLIYVLACISIRKHRFSFSTDSTKSDIAKRMTQLRLRNQNRFLTTVFIINVVLLGGIVPIIVGTYLSNTIEGPVSSTLDVLSFLVDILFFLNMAVNPFLYIWRLPKYRKTFLVMYCCKK